MNNLYWSSGKFCLGGGGRGVLKSFWMLRSMVRFPTPPHVFCTHHHCGQSYCKRTLHVKMETSRFFVFRKSVMSIKFPPAILGRKWLRQFHGRLAFFGSFCCKTPMQINFLLLGGGVLGFFQTGGWKCQFYFYGRGDFSD